MNARNHPFRFGKVLTGSRRKRNGRSLKRLAFLASFFLFCGLARPSVSDTDDPAGPVLLDALAAVVDGEIITLSDVQVARALEMLPVDGSSGLFLQRMIDERLKYNEASRIPVIRVNDADVERALEEYAGRFKDEQTMHSFFSDLGLEVDQVKRFLRRRLLVERYIDYRFRPFIMVEPMEVNQATRRMLSEGKAAELDAGRIKESVRNALTEEKLDKAVVEWVQRLRAKADVTLLLDPGAPRAAVQAKE